MTIYELLKSLNEALFCWAGPKVPVVFRDKDGVERPIAKVKMRGSDTVILCEREDD